MNFILPCLYKHSHRLRSAFYLTIYLVTFLSSEAAVLLMWHTAFQTALYDGSSNLITAAVRLKTTVNMVGCVWTVKPAGRPLIGIRHFSSNREKILRSITGVWPPRLEHFHSPLSSARQMSLRNQHHAVFSTYEPVNRIFKKDGTNKPRTWQCRPSSYCG
jgi:hypothetical protein